MKNFFQRLKGKHLCLISNKKYFLTSSEWMFIAIICCDSTLKSSCLFAIYLLIFSPKQAELCWNVMWIRTHPSIFSCAPTHARWEHVESRWRDVTVLQPSLWIYGCRSEGHSVKLQNEGIWCLLVFVSRRSHQSALEGINLEWLSLTVLNFVLLFSLMKMMMMPLFLFLMSLSVWLVFEIEWVFINLWIVTGTKPITLATNAVFIFHILSSVERERA